MDRDLKTVRGFTVYAHEETPGLGGEVDNPKWQASWIGKTAFDNAGQLIIKVIKGKPSPDSINEIDGLSGATITTRGIDDFIKFWFSEKGYAPFLEKLKKEGMNE
jgi:Na+-transporting NADH:ubiquinone oxidoreductase subunit C